MKKIVSLILLLILMLTIAGCGNGGEEGKYYKITFRQKNYADIVEVVDEGEDLPANKLPIIHNREGYTAVWGDNDFTNITADKIVEPVYTPKTYTIDYNTNGGIEITETTTVTYDARYELKTTTKENLHFGGWYYNDKIVYNTGYWKVDGNSTIVLNARWEYRITFVAEIEDVEYINHVYVEVGRTIQKENIPKVPTYGNYFGYWDIEDYTTITSNATIYAKYTPFPEWSESH